MPNEQIGKIKALSYVFTHGTRLSVMQNEYEKWIKPIMEKVKETRDKITKLYSEIEILSGEAFPFEEDLSFLDPKPEVNNSLAERIRNTGKTRNAQKENNLALIPSTPENEMALKFHSQVEIDRSPIKELEDNIQKLLCDLKEKFELIEEYINSLESNKDKEYFPLIKEKSKSGYKDLHEKEILDGVKEIDKFLKEIEPQKEIMDIYIKTSYSVNKVEELNKKGRSQDWDLIMEDYVALKNKMKLLKDLLSIKKYDDNKTKKTIAEIKVLTERLGNLGLKSIERKERILEVRASAEKQIESLRQTLNLVGSMNHGIQEELKSELAQDIKVVLKELDDMLNQLKETPALIDRGIIADWFSKQMAKIKEIEDRCATIGLGRILKHENKKLIEASFNDQNIIDIQYKNVENAESNEYIDKLVDKQYQGCLDLLEKSRLYEMGDKRHPEKSEVRELLRTKINPEQLEIIKQMQKPVLQLVPIRLMEEYKKALNLHKPMVVKGTAQDDAYVPDWTKDAFERANVRDKAESGKITSFRVVITEGADAPDSLSGDDKEKKIEERCAWFKDNYESKGIRGSDYKSYMLLQIAGLLKTPPRPVDDINGADKTWTMLNMEGIFSRLVAGGSWNVCNCHVNLNSFRAVNQGDRARFRASVMVDVP